MHIKTISVTYGRKINLGDYSSAEIALSVWADLEPGDDADRAAAELQAFCRDRARAEYLRLKNCVKDPANGKLD